MADTSKRSKRDTDDSNNNDDDARSADAGDTSTDDTAEGAQDPNAGAERALPQDPQVLRADTGQPASNVGPHVVRTTDGTAPPPDEPHTRSTRTGA